MPYLTNDRVTRASKALKNKLRKELGEETLLHQCRRALAEGFDFDRVGEMDRSLPCEATWNREWCVNHLVDEGYVSSVQIANEAVEAIEARLPFVFLDEFPLDDEARPGKWQVN